MVPCMWLLIGGGVQIMRIFLFLPIVFITNKISSFCLQVALQILCRKLPQSCAHLCSAVIGYLSTRNASADGRYGQDLGTSQG